MNQANKQEAKVALVTGGARRIGSAIVKSLHAAGYKVVIHCQNSVAQAQVLAQDLNAIRADSALVLQKELLEVDAPHLVRQTILNWTGRLDLLVNNASIFIRSDSNAFNYDEWDQLFQTNVKAPFLLSITLRDMLAVHQGVIINITDIHGQRPLKGYAVYCQTKAALEMQTKALAREFAPQIRVNGVAPGAIMWPEDKNILAVDAQKHIIDQTPLKRHGHPDFIAQAVLSLAENAFVTGQILNVDGGRGI